MKRTKLVTLFAILGCVVFPTLAAGSPQGAVPPPPPPPPPQSAVPPPPTTTEYKSDATKAWGEAPVPDAGAPEAPPTPAAAPAAPTQADSLKQKCDAALKEGKSLPECKAAELDIVFQGGMGSKPVAAPALPQAGDTESKQLIEKKLAIEEKAQLVSDGNMDLWAVARRERPLLEEAPARYLAVGVRVGYPFLVARGSGLRRGFQPIIHTSVEGAYQALRFLQIALVADFQALRGTTVDEQEYLPEENVVYEDGDERPLRDIGSLLDDYFGVGVRPTLRVGGEWRSFQAFLGLGFGWHFQHASGRWRSKLDATDRANSDDASYGQANWKGNDYAIYSFEESDNGAYSVFEFSAMYRFLEGHLGAGLMLEYTILLHGRTDPDVKIDSQYGLDDPLNNPAGWQGYTAQEDDYEETLVRHLGAMNFITLGAVADYRF